MVYKRYYTANKFWRRFTMKINKLFAGISAAAIAATMCSFSTSAVAEGAASVDFEDGDCSFVYMNVDDAGSDESVLSVADYEGSKQLKIDVKDSTKVPKVWFDLYKIMPKDSVPSIASMEFDLTIVPKDSSKQLGWMGGAVGAAGSYGTQKNPAWSSGDWTCDDNNLYVDGGVAKVHVKRTFLLKATQGFTAKSESPFFGFMTWANQNGTEYEMYVDNMVFSDDAGKAITLGVPAVEETTAEETTAAVEETTAAETEAPEVITAADETAAETEAAPAETEAAPAETAAETTAAETTAAATTDAPAKTGNTAAAAIVAVMAVAGAAAVITKKRG